MSLHHLLTKLAERVPGCVATSVVGMDDGLPLLSIGDIDTAAPDAFHSELFRRTEQALVDLGATVSNVKGSVLEASEHVFIASPIGDTNFFWHVVVERGTTLGFVQAMMRKNEGELLGELVALLD